MTVFLNKTIYFAILAVVFLLPVYLIRFKVFGLPTSLLEVLIYILFLLWVVRCVFFSRLLNDAFCIGLAVGLFGYKYNKGDKKYHLAIWRNSLFVGLFLFVSGALLASVFSFDKEASLGLFKAYFFDPLLFFIVAIFSLKIGNINIILKTYLFPALGVSILSFFYFLGDELTHDGRLQGIFNSPNFLAMYIVPAIIIGLWQLLFNSHTERLNIWFYRFVLAFLIFILYLTASYGAFLGIILAAFFMLFFQSPNTWKSYSHTLGATAGIILLLLAFQWPTAKFQKLLSFSQESSITQRIYIWKASVSILKDNFLLGIGPGTFQDYYQIYRSKNSPCLSKSEAIGDKQQCRTLVWPIDGMDWSVPYPHNTLLAFFIQNGLIGGIGFLLLLFWYVKSVFEIFKSEQKKYAVLFGAFLVYFLVHGMADTLYWKNDLSLIFFMFIVVLSVVKRDNKLRN